MDNARIASLTLKNPLILGSSDLTSWDHDMIARAVDAGFGGIVLKSVTDIDELQSPGITQWAWDDYGLLSVGGPMLSLSNARSVSSDLLARAIAAHCRTIGSICARSLESWRDIARFLEDMGADALELNFGNPHAQGLPGLEAIHLVKASVKCPVFAKVPRSRTRDVKWLHNAVDAGVDALVIAHRPQGLAYDALGQPKLGGVAGYSGPWLKSLTLADLTASRELPVPLIASGGFCSAADLQEALWTGAKAVQMTGVFYRHGLGHARELLASLDNYVNNSRIGR